MAEPFPRQAVTRLLAEGGFGGTFSHAPLAGGANNQVHLLEGDGWRVVLKRYFHHAGDPRDRYAAEWGFINFAQEFGIRCVPAAIAGDAEARLALYSFLPGRLPGAAEVDGRAVSAAARFFADLNRAHVRTAGLGDASEACFSLSSHAALVAGRVERLCGAVGPAGEFARETLVPALKAVTDRAESRVGDEWARELEPEGCCLTPSDFGFHNALLGPDGTFRFIDFEYAGRDDPAKMVCDFFCQPKRPVSTAHFDAFFKEALAGFSDPAFWRRRIDFLFPLYRVKWCCILLAPFLPEGAERRAFAETRGGKAVDAGAATARARVLLAQPEISP